MLHLNRLSFQNIGRFVGEHTVDLKAKSNFIQVDAENHNTGGSSGGGKSTFFLALEYLLGINDTPSTVLQSRLTKNPLSVEGEIDKDGKIYTVKRHKSDGLSIVGPDINVSGSSKEAEAKLDEILEIPRSLLRPMIHKRQNEGGFFLSKTPKQSYEFLMECLGMNSINQKSDKIEASLKEDEQKIVLLKSQVSSSRESLSMAKNMVEGMNPPKCDVDEASLARVFERIESTKKIRNDLVKELEVKLSLMSKPPEFTYSENKELVEMIQKKEGEVAALSARAGDISGRLHYLSSNVRVNQSSIKVSEDAIMRKPGLQEELLDLKSKIVEAMKKTCPTCKQHLQSDALAGSVSAPLVEKAQKIKLEIDAISNMEDKLPLIKKHLEEDMSEITSLEEEKIKVTNAFNSSKAEFLALAKLKEESKAKAISDYRAICDMMEKDRKMIADQYAPQIMTLDNGLDAYNQAYYRGQATLKSHREALESYERQKNSYQSKIAELESSVSQKELELSSLERKIKISSASLKLLKSYANQLFQDSLAIVGETATKILSRIPNMGTGTITFDSYKETKSGSLKEEVVAILSVDEEVDVPIRSMSGGERAAVDLAVDLAVIDMIEEKTGNGMDIFILDEPFDGLDAICRENCLEVLKNHASQRKIIIVDHSTETKQMVQDKIVVFRDGQTSRIDDSL